jgi:heat shock protein HslJ
MTRHTLFLGLAITGMTMLAACSPGSATSPSAPAPAAPGLNGKTYLSTGIKGAALVPGTRIQLTFKDGTLNAHGGCNSMGGTYTIVGDRLKTTQLSMTEMGCDEPRMKQDGWLARFLGDVAVTLTGDTLTLTDGTATLTLLDRVVANPDRPLEGTRWVLDGVLAGDTASSVPAGVTAAIQISGGSATIESGCNTGGGTVAVAGDTLTFGPIGLTKMACEPNAMAVERAVIGVLSKPVVYTISGDGLTLDAGGPGLTFHAAR